MLAADNMIRTEGEVIADKDARAEGNADGQALVMRVSKTQHIGIVTVRATQAQDAKVAHPVRRCRMVLFSDFVLIEAQRVAHQLHDLVVRYGNVAVSSRRR